MKKIIVFITLGLIVVAFATMKFYKKNNNNTVRIGLVGDVMLGRSVNELLRTNPSHNLWGTMLPHLQAQDLVIANLETAVTMQNQAVPKVFNFKTDPAHLDVLHQANIAAVTIANNHLLDYGLVGLQDTLSALQKADIAFVGAGMNARQARNPYLFSVHGVSCALFGATDNEPTWKATESKPGTNYITVGDQRFLEDIKTVRPSVDLVIVTLHWGPNMREYPTQDFIDYAHQMIDAGADIIAGHSAHIVQGIEMYKGRLIIYDMGDFIDDYAVDNVLRNDLGGLYSITIHDKKVVGLTIIPAHIEDMVVNHASGDQAQTLFDLIKKRSHPFGTTFQEQNGMLYSVIFNAGSV